MSSFNSITKLKYNGDAADLVVLNEYILFRDEKSRRSYIIFKFRNNVTQQLLGMRFEVSQYDVDGNLVEKSIVIYNKFLAGAEEDFVPKAKLRVSFQCATISIKLLQAAFDRFVWKEGDFEDNSYKFDHFFHDEKLLEESEDTKKVKRVKEKKEKVKKPKKSKKPFILKDATKRNFAKFPVVFNVIVFIAVIAFVLATVLIYRFNPKEFTYDNYELRVIDKNSVAIYDYNGSATELVIPEKINGYRVAVIDGGAFKGSNITSVEFDCGLTVNAEAFAECKKLLKISSEYYCSVKGDAFRGCTALERVDLGNSELYRGAFNGCNFIYVNYGRLIGCTDSRALFESVQ